MTLNANAIPYFFLGGGGLQIFLYVIVNTVKVNIHMPKVCQFFSHAHFISNFKTRLILEGFRLLIFVRI